MQMLARKPADAYRKVDLDARIEASSGEDLTRICLEDAIATLGQALLALDRNPAEVPRDKLQRAHGIILWLARSVAPENPLHDAMAQFYGGLAVTVASNLRRASVAQLDQVRRDLDDLLSAAKQV